MITAGMYIRPDFWTYVEKLEAGDNYRDESFPGCQFRIPAGYIGGKPQYHLAVNVKKTGNVRNREGMVRCRIEFVRDGEPSTFTGGWIQG